MRKRIFALLCAILLVTPIFTSAEYTEYAERRMIAPAYIASESDGFPKECSLSIRKFYIKDVYFIEQSDRKRAEYVMDYKGISGIPDMVVYCYNEKGKLLEIIDFDYGGYIDVPGYTAMIEIAAKEPIKGTQTLFYEKYINVYSKDGKAKGITDLMFPEYQARGWSKTKSVTLYAFENGGFTRIITVSEEQVEAYKKVGWYTKEDVENAVMLYAPPSKSMRVPLDQVWLYERLGWSRPVTVYAFENGGFARTLEISPLEVEAYKKVGWYTKEDVENAVTMYAPSKSMRVPLDQVWIYERLGWSKAPRTSPGLTPSPAYDRNMVLRVAGYRLFNDDPLNYEFAYGAEKFTEKYGAKVEFLVGGGDGRGDDLIAGIVSGDPWEIQHCFGISVFPLTFAEGLYTPIDEYIDYYDNDMIDEITVEGAKWLGKHYGVSSLYMQDVWYLAYNETWMRELGIKTPHDYYKEGNWTLNSYKEVNAAATAKGVASRSAVTRPHTGSRYLSEWNEQTGEVKVAYNQPSNFVWLSFWADILRDSRYNIKGSGYVSSRNVIMKDEVMPNLMKDELKQYTKDTIRYIHFPNPDGKHGTYLTDSHFLFPIGVPKYKLPYAVMLASYMAGTKSDLVSGFYDRNMCNEDRAIFKTNMENAYYLPRIFYSDAFAIGNTFRQDMAAGKSVTVHIAEQTPMLKAIAAEFNAMYAN